MEKKIYSTPQLSSYGDVEALTQQTGGKGNADLVYGQSVTLGDAGAGYLCSTPLKSS